MACNQSRQNVGQYVNVCGKLTSFKHPIIVRRLFMCAKTNMFFCKIQNNLKGFLSLKNVILKNSSRFNVI